MKKTISVIGMACASCSANVERKLNSLPGISQASVSLPSRTANVEYNPDAISLEKMKKEINAIGYDLIIEEDRSVAEIEKREYTLLKRRTSLSWIFCLPQVYATRLMPSVVPLVKIISSEEGALINF